MTDILNARRSSSDICWILKDYESKISYFNNYKTKDIIRKTLLDSLEFKYDIKLLSDKMGKTEIELLKESESILSNMSHNIGMNSIRFMGVTLSKIMKKLYTNVRVNDDGISKLREALKDSNVILLPTHRSYADFLLVSYIMFVYNLPMPVIAAAMDFMNMKFVGELLRSCGAFFIRRSFVDDDLYWNVFSHYIKTLIKISQESLEFFIEGTRSRTNKSLYPKIGMLGIVLEMWLSGSADVKLVPIGISYDRILEEKLYAWELYGVPKPKESTSGLLKVRHILSENYGNVYFNVGDPISISELANQFSVKRIDHNLELRFRPSLFESEKQFLRQLSKIIVEKQQVNVIVSDWSIIVLIMMHHQRGKEVGVMSMDRLVQAYKHMAILLASFGAHLAAGPTVTLDTLTDNAVLEHINASLRVHSSLVTVADGGVSLLSHDHPVDSPSGETQWTTKVVDSILVAIYRNPVLFHLSRESLLLARIRSRSVGDEGQQAIADDFKSVLDLMSREFVYSGTWQKNFDVSLAKLRQSLLLVNQWTINETHPCLEMVEGALTPFIMAYIVHGHVFVTEIVHQSTSTTTAENVKKMQEVIITLCRQCSWIGRYYLEMCSLDIARNALAQMMDLNKRDSLNTVKIILAALDNFLPYDTRLHLSEAMHDMKGRLVEKAVP